MAYRYDIVTPAALRTFARTLAAALRIGEEAYLEPASSRLTVRVLNAGRSAHIVFVFQGPFFERQEGPGEAVERPPHFKVAIRSLLNVFKALHPIQAATLQLPLRGDQVVVTLDCQHGIRKVYRLSYEDTESPKAQHTPDPACHCAFQANPRQLAELLGNLAAKVDKVTLLPEASRLRLRSYVEEEVADLHLRTECAVDTRDLLSYAHVSPTGVPFSKTFQLKEFKALLGFCEAGNLPLRVSFGRGNEPVLCETSVPDDSRAFWAQLLIAAFDDLEDAEPVPGPPMGTPIRPGSQAPSIRSFASPSASKASPPAPSPATPLRTPEFQPSPPGQTRPPELGPHMPGAGSPSSSWGNPSVPPQPLPRFSEPSPPTGPPATAVMDLCTPLPYVGPQTGPIPDDTEVEETPAKRLRVEGSPAGGLDQVCSAVSALNRSVVSSTPLASGPRTPHPVLMPVPAAPEFTHTDAIAAAAPEVYTTDGDPPHRYEYCPLSWEEEEEEEADRHQVFIEPSPSPPRPDLF